MLCHLLDEKIVKLEMSVFCFALSDSETADHCVFAWKTLVPSLSRKGVAFDKL